MLDSRCVLLVVLLLFTAIGAADDGLGAGAMSVFVLVYLKRQCNLPSGSVDVLTV